MKKILLISNHVFHYRQGVYDYFFDAFQENGYEFHVLSNSYQQVNRKNRFIFHELSFSVPKYIRFLEQMKPDVVILFLHLKDIVMLPVIFWCRKNKVPVIYWNHGINSLTPNARFKNAVFHFVHRKCDALITYSPEMRKNFPKEMSDRLFIAPNTLNMSEINRQAFPTKEELRKKYGIREEKVVLFVSRMVEYKRPELLVRALGSVGDIAVVLVGPGITPTLQQEIDAHFNVYYLGEKYGREADEVYAMGDVFSTPGHIGLAIVQAFFWGLPVVLLDVRHAPEICYMKDGETGYLVRNEADLGSVIVDLLRDGETLSAMSGRCQEVFEKEADIRLMYKGFLDAVEYCLSK